jgi:ribonuclease-3
VSAIHETHKELQQRLGYSFSDEELLTRALTHKSYSHESRDKTAQHNETFEFLGDSVLGFVIGDLIFRQFPALDEGALSKMKAYLVSAPVLSKKARDHGMGEALLLGVGEEKSGGRKKDSLLANLYEAIIAAVYLDSGLEAAREFIERGFRQDLDSIDSTDLLFLDFKTALQEIAQAMGLPLPDYSVVEEIGPDHDKKFVVQVKLTNQIVAQGVGSSKKEAQQKAAREALRMHQDRQQSRELAPAAATAERRED